MGKIREQAREQAGKLVGFVCDPIAQFNPKKDTTIALMRAARDAGYRVVAFGRDDLSIRQNHAWGYGQELTILDDPHDWYQLAGDRQDLALSACDIIMMRCDPPVNKSYIYATYILDQAARDGVKIWNAPAALRNYNEKIYATHFPELTPQTLISSRAQDIRDFVATHDKVVIKPLDLMGGQGIYITHHGDPNLDSIIEMELKAEQAGPYPSAILAQAFIPSITQGGDDVKGDRRVIIIHGEPVSHALHRHPKPGSLRGNLAAGGSYDVQPLTDREWEIGRIVGQRLLVDGVVFAGIDIIGGHLIEINHTSPTGIQEISTKMGEPVAMRLFDVKL